VTNDELKTSPLAIGDKKPPGKAAPLGGFIFQAPSAAILRQPQ
jgi:hypothetical protein